MILLRRLLVCSVTTACVVLAPSNFAQQVTTMSAPSHDKNGPIVNAPAGSIEGRTEGELRVFRGIPYALPQWAQRAGDRPARCRGGPASEKQPSSGPHASSHKAHFRVSIPGFQCL